MFSSDKNEYFDLKEPLSVDEKECRRAKQQQDQRKIILPNVAAAAATTTTLGCPFFHHQSHNKNDLPLIPQRYHDWPK